MKHLTNSLQGQRKTRRLRPHNNITKRQKQTKNDKDKIEKLREKCKSLAVRVLPSFEDELEKTPVYQNAKIMESVEKELVKRFKTPFTPSKILPNDDFYTYINYRWLKNTREQMDNASKKNEEIYYVQIDDFRILQDRVYHELIDIVKDYIKTHHTREAKLLNNVYTSMLTLDSTPIKMHTAKMIKNYDYYVARDNMWEYMANINKNEVVSWACPINWKVMPDEKNSTIFRNYISFPQLGLYDYLLYLEDSPADKPEQRNYRRRVKGKYLHYIKEVFDSCLGKNHGLHPHDVFEVEYEILIAMGCNAIKKDSSEFYNIVTKEEALKKYGFDWEQFSHFLGYKKTPDFFICDSLNYLLCMSELLKKNWKTPKWKSFWFFLYLKQMIRFDGKLRNLYFEFNGKFLHGQPNLVPRSIYPVIALTVTFNTLLTKEYVKRNYDVNKVKYVENMGHDLLAVYKRIIGRNKWLSPKTKKYALLKLDHLKLEISQPKELRYDPLLDYTPDDAWGNLEKQCLWKMKKYVDLEGRDVIDIPLVDWNTFKLTGKQAYIVNAFYTPTENSIYIPLAYLQKPFIDLDERGIEYNLAHVGYTLTHEMSHSLDETGSKYDHKGNLHNWWTKEDKIKYKRIIKDIIKQYEVFAAYDKIEFDAEIGIGEDMADISGLAICEEYLRDFQMKNSDIVPIASLSFQAFFVYFAFQQRQHVYKKAFEAQLKTNPHPLDKYRTNVPLSRIELFRSLYNVKKGDKMWWHSTSTIW
jgi:predicted metalloendopeptidase